MGARMTGWASGQRLAIVALTLTLAAIPVASAVLLNSPVAPAAQGLAADVPAIGDNTTIHACVAKLTGVVRIPQRGGSCLLTETPLAWNVTGPQGPPGEPGAPGEDGAPGSPGVSGLERVDFSSRSDNVTALKHAFARCSADKHVVGGGANIMIAGTALGDIVLKKSYPDDNMNGWAATAEALGQGPNSPNWFITAYALCANVAD